ncbi:hypothetical protein NX059_003609 [Plenodomus lindquistii]|nr:hypothetical protein NX059_003609 [Plenodomus lindquistii]
MNPRDMYDKCWRVHVKPELGSCIRTLKIEFNDLDDNDIGHHLRCQEILSYADKLLTLDITEPLSPYHQDSEAWYSADVMTAALKDGGWLGTLNNATAGQPVLMLQARATKMLASLKELPQPTSLVNWTVPTGSCNIREWVFYRTYMDISAAAKMIESCKALKGLTYYHDGHRWVRNGPTTHPRSRYTPQSWETLGNALGLHSNTPHKLTAYFEFGSNGPPSQQPDLGTLGSLVEFHR